MERTVIQFDDLHATEDFVDETETTIHGLHLGGTEGLEVTCKFCVDGQHQDDGSDTDKDRPSDEVVQHP